MEPESLLRFAQETAIGICPEPDESSLYPHAIFLISVLILYSRLHTGLLNGAFLLVFLQKFVRITRRWSACYIPCPSHSPLLDHYNYNWRGIQVMKLLILQLSPAYCYFMLLEYRFPSISSFKIIRQSPRLYKFRTRLFF